MIDGMVLMITLIMMELGKGYSSFQILPSIGIISIDQLHGLAYV